MIGLRVCNKNGDWKWKDYLKIQGVKRHRSDQTCLMRRSGVEYLVTCMCVYSSLEETEHFFFKDFCQFFF